MRITHLTKSYYSADAGACVPVFHDFSLSIPVQSIMVITGRPVVEKTTLLHLVAGLTAPDSGSIVREPSETGAVSYLFQEPRLLPWRNVFPNVELPCEPRCLTRESEMRRFFASFRWSVCPAMKRICRRNCRGGCVSGRDRPGIRLSVETHPAG
jgi:ABC-type nitrate/sulfonate/bicarbonate transport system ATPase subunit